MELMLQPNQWSCLPTSIAMLVHNDIHSDSTLYSTVKDVYALLVNYDYDQKTNHYQELILTCYRIFNRRLIYLDAIANQYHDWELPAQKLLDELEKSINSDNIIMTEPIEKYYYELQKELVRINQIDKIHGLMKNNNGVLVGSIFDNKIKYHAVAWEHKEQLIYDPNGTKYKYKYEKDNKNSFIIQGFIF